MSEEKLFGMPAEKGRWMFVVLGFIINICLEGLRLQRLQGPRLKTPEHERHRGGHALHGLPGPVRHHGVLRRVCSRQLGPKMLGWLGGVVVGVGWILASFSTSGTMLTITYGLIGGGGVGLAYGVPLAVAGRWFPQERGLALGSHPRRLRRLPLRVGQRGGGPDKGRWPHVNLLLYGCRLPGHHSCVLHSLQVPQGRLAPAGWKPPAAAAASAIDLSMGEMAKTSTFMGLFLCYIIGSLAGLMAIGISASVAQEIIKIDAATAATLVGVFAIFNGAGGRSSACSRTSSRPGLRRSFPSFSSWSARWAC